MERVCGIIPTFNGEKHLERALEQLHKACDEVIVVDSGSTDKTLEIASKFPCKIIEHPFESYGAQCTFAATQTDCNWILVNDHDEVISDDLAKEIMSLKTNGFEKNIYIVKRNNYFLGKIIKHSGWGDEGETKMFDKRKGRHTFENHATIIPFDGNDSIGTLKNLADHYPYKDLKHYLEKVSTYADLAAEEAAVKGKVFKLRYLIFNPFVRFIKKYFIQKGFLDGFHGFVLAVMSYYSVFVKYLRLWEIQKKQ